MHRHRFFHYYMSEIRRFVYWVLDGAGLERRYICYETAYDFGSSQNEIRPSPVKVEVRANAPDDH